MKKFILDTRMLPNPEIVGDLVFFEADDEETAINIWLRAATAVVYFMDNKGEDEEE